jgi:hypothetical protein
MAFYLHGWTFLTILAMDMVVSLATSLGLATAGGMASNAQTAPNTEPHNAQESNQNGVIHGTVNVRTLPLQGVHVTASNALTGKQVTTTTDATGVYSLALPRGKRYMIRADFNHRGSAKHERQPGTSELLPAKIIRSLPHTPLVATIRKLAIGSRLTLETIEDNCYAPDSRPESFAPPIGIRYSAWYPIRS